uniref:Uncharacterized protein n=1 Tax=Anopheles albimanus TaxID=7167 RepID=A0A182FXH3_ANOAL
MIFHLPHQQTADALTATFPCHNHTLDENGMRIGWNRRKFGVRKDGRFFASVRRKHEACR